MSVAPVHVKNPSQERKDRVALLFREAFARGRATVLVCEGAHLPGMKRFIARLAQILDPRHFRVHWHGRTGGEIKSRPFLLPYWRALPRFGEVLILERSYYYDLLLGRAAGKTGKKRFGELVREINDFEWTLHHNETRVFKIAFDRSRKKLEKDYKKARSRKKDPISLLEEDLEFLLKNYDAVESFMGDLIEATNPYHSPWFRPTVQSYRKLEEDILNFLIARLEEDLSLNSLEAVKEFDEAMDRMRLVSGRKHDTEAPHVPVV